jgi:hypothetical protein
MRRRRPAPAIPENTNPDVLAFHEAFADIVAIFHTSPCPNCCLRDARLRGDLTRPRCRIWRQFGNPCTTVVRCGARSTFDQRSSVQTI